MPRNQPTGSMMNKNLPKFVKYIFPSSKEWTRVWFLGYRDLRLHFASISTEIIDVIGLGVNLHTISVKLFTLPTEKTHKCAASDE